MKHQPRCELCGKFISYKDFEQNNVRIHFIPDTHFSAEKIEYTHSKCETK